ncbi:unnamed protein product [Cladocopium goreaui]|uniref:Uncharacterized protein n=1 Tax=Cladocopium goreaui TaxID=2562237 RepID=A0A9P1C200_9DINO|nr:unnamed protein product [Cladocopium goreaui]
MAIDIYKHIEKEFPPEPGEVQRTLALLMMLNGLQSNPNLPGVEKFVLADVNEKWLQSKSMRISSGEVGADQGLVPPQSLFAAKGWNRSVCAMLVMVATYELGDALLKVILNDPLHKGVTLVSTAIRRRPNAFNLLHQCELMLCTGVAGEAALQSLQAFDNASAFASVYQVGKLEAGACTNLLKHMDQSTRDALRDLVRRHGQPKFILHDGLAAGIFNATYNGAGSGLQPWEACLQNTSEVLQRVCCAFKACCARFKELVPAGFYAKVESEIMATFMHRHADADLTALLTATVPPADLNKVSVFAAHLDKFHQEAQESKLQKAAELSAALLQTTWSQTELQIEDDMTKLRTWAAKFHLFASQQGGMDVQYLSGRYEKGKIAVCKYMQKRHCTVQHRSIVLAHGDIVEKQARSFDVSEVALAFNTSSHQGDKRKTSQQCLFATLAGHKVNELAKSKAMLGSITAVDRSRVSELQNPEEDKPLAAHWRVQQRGVTATRTVIEKILDGLSIKSQPVLVVDCMPNRFLEWSSACLSMQLEELTSMDNYRGPCMHYMGIFLEDDAALSRTLESTVAGKIMSDWIPDLVKNKYANSHGASLKTMSDMITADKDVATALKGSAGESSVQPSASGAATESPAVQGVRTLASPDYDGQPVPNFHRRVDFEEKPLDEFNASQTLHCCATLANSALKIGKTQNDGAWWIINETSQNVDLDSRELFGFNVGSFAEVPTGDASTLVDQIAWTVGSDMDVICLSTQEGTNIVKKLMTVADAVCSCTMYNQYESIPPKKTC